MLTRFFFLLLFLGWTGYRAQAQGKRFAFMQPKMGSPFNLILYAPDSATAEGLARQSFELIDSLNNIFSDYLPDSELNRLSATAGKDSFVPVSPLLFHIIQISKEAWLKSSGTYDITIGPLSRLWRQARRRQHFPPESEVHQAKQVIGFSKVAIDTAARRIRLERAGMQLDLGGIAKGFVAQQVIDFLKSKGIEAALADAGGDIVCSGAPPATPGWTVGINVPEHTDQLLPQTIILQNKSIATSGDVYQYTEYKGKRYAHIINPRTGYGVTFQRNVTIIATDGAAADWLATACSILPIAKAKKLAKQQKAALLITQMKGKKVKYYTTRSMRSYFK